MTNEEYLTNLKIQFEEGKKRLNDDIDKGSVFDAVQRIRDIIDIRWEIHNTERMIERDM